MATTALGTTASADNTFTGSIGFIPNEARAGDNVDIIGTCDDPAFTTTPVISDVLNAEDLRGREDGSGGKSLISHATVKAGVQPGRHKVSFKCGTETVTGYLSVVADPRPPRPSISVEPKKGVAGTKVEIEVICVDLQPVTSAALAIGSVTTLPGGGEGRPYFEVAAKVKNVKPGVYRVSTKCDGKPISTTFTVVGSNSNAQVPVKPKGAAETGDLPDA